MMDEYKSLDIRIQEWIFKQGWSDLREIQKKAIPPILAGDRDVLISAATAAGKTEAFFLPACSSICDLEQGFGILYISPLKALINDQHRRLEGLCDTLNMPLTPWHGDSPQSKKKKVKKNPAGILLITPESLESLMVREPGWVEQAFPKIKYIAIDEFHAFIGTDRGYQLISLLNRLEHLLKRYSDPIPRVALSATLGDLEKVPLSLRPGQTIPCEIITSSQTSTTIKVQVRGYENPINTEPEDGATTAEYSICEDLYKLCRGGSHLIFANSRSRTESIAAQLSSFSERDYVPDEFFPHHGSLSKDLREVLETRLQKEDLPTTAVCTMTLELGIDIGKVNSVNQVTPPYSVSSLRQRLGRSGRRNEPAILRMFIPEDEITLNSGMVCKLRMELLQSIAMVRLLIESKWFEPADMRQFHFSTLLHQILAVIAQYGDVSINDLFNILCKTGPFQNISASHFKLILKHMGESELITQLHSGELVPGLEGERLVGLYNFYAVFKVPEEYRIIDGSKTLGVVPVDSLVTEGAHIIFAGSYWKVLKINSEKKEVIVEKTKGGNPPKFGGSTMSIHDKVRQEMYRIYCEGDYRISVGERKVDFIDASAKELFKEGAYYFKEADLKNRQIIQEGETVYILTWMGDKVVNTLSAILLRNDFNIISFAGVISIPNTSTDKVVSYLKKVVKAGLPEEKTLAEMIPMKKINKYDGYLPEEILCEGYGAYAFDTINTGKWLSKLLDNYSNEPV